MSQPLDASRRLSLLITLVGGGVIIVAGALLFDTYWGDPTIYLPYARNIARGDFFAYNPGAFSSGSTSPLWAAMLAIPFLLGLGAAGAKVFALLCTLGAYAVVLLATQRMTAGKSSGSLAAMYLVEMMTLFGVLMYESSLVVALVALSIVAGDRLTRRSAQMDQQGSMKEFVMLTLVWAGLPLSRPDAVILVILQAIALWICLPGSRGGNLGKLVLAGCVAAIPSALYFGYSLLTLGTVSVSSRCRAFALIESAQHIGPILYSKSALAYIGSILYAILLAALGLDLFRREDRTRWLAIYGTGALVIYPVLLTFVQPVTNDLARYFLPVAPLIVVAMARTFGEWEDKRSRAWAVTLAVVGMLFIIKPLGAVLGDAVDQRGRGYSFDEIVERDVIEKVNQLAQRGDTLLAYEVQDRYYLRDDVGLLSLDGITDGKVGPYLASGDIEAFLKKHRPGYWLANDAVNYRPYLRRSMLSDVVKQFESDTTRREFTSHGVTFQLLERRSRPMPRGFAGWTMLFKLEY